VIRDHWRRLRGRLRLLRVQPGPTSLLGPLHRRSRTRIELDITWACDLRCANCNRSCAQAPTGEQMTVDQVRRFVDDSLARGHRWERIRVLGGEPTLHPHLAEILAELDRYRQQLPAVVIEIATHGHGERTRAVLATLPDWVRVDNSHKESAEQSFEPFNVAPTDTEDLARAAFRNGCPITTVCGIGLGPRGYYPCAVAGGIDRVFGFDAGRTELPPDGDDLLDQLDRFCRLCGHFDPRVRTPARAPVMSETWAKAYARWHEARRTQPGRR
jgi:Radical SAM superfamily/4Fe-4S single cluster domain